ncbi:MAG: AMIN-like domain-containing (lipo)protein [Candidatus Dormibacteraceae bacterium]
MSNQGFRSELNAAFDQISGAPSPALRDRVRSSLEEPAPERRGPFWIAGVAAAAIAAVIIGVLFFANPLRHSNGLPAGRVNSPTPSATATAFTCNETGMTFKPTTPPSAPAVAFIDALRTGTHPGYDRLTIEFQNGAPAGIDVQVQAGTTFTQAGSGQAILLKGSHGILVVIHGADLHTAYSGPTDIKPGNGALVEVRQVEDFEGTVQLGLGIAGPGCYQVSFLANPDRLVIDVQAP